MRIVYWLDRDASIRVIVYNAIGEKVDVISGRGMAGSDNQLEVDISRYAPGVYYYLLEVKSAVTHRYEPRKFVVEK